MTLHVVGLDCSFAKMGIADEVHMELKIRVNQGLK